MESGGASKTAVFVCQGRATATGLLAVGAFADPVAERLLADVELRAVTLARTTASPPDGRERFLVHSLRACASAVVPRTVCIDRAVEEALARDPQAQVVILGAGLDARPWRLASLAGRLVVSVDHPASQADLRRRAAGLPAPLCDLRFAPVDLAREHLADALRGVGHDHTQPTVWVWEGVIPYLEASDVR